jgi:glycine/D-amino acid oxidase-like deaminating enzyme
VSIQKKHLAIVGAGLAGLALAWHLSRYNTATTPLSITLYDYREIAAGTSGIAAGLLHPYGGRWAKISWRAEAAMKATLELLEIASTALGRSVATQSSLLRLPTDSKQVEAFRENTLLFPENLWWEQDLVAAALPFLSPSPALYIKSAYTVDCQSYLKGLWHACQAQGVTLKKQKISSLADIPCDIAIAATGAEKLPELKNVPLNALKGQTIVLNWPSKLPPQAYPITSDIYMLPLQNGQQCLVGATFERTFSSPSPDTAGAQYLLERASKVCPALQEATILEQQAGIRATTPHRHPLYEPLKDHPSCWVAAGLGSKGLLYHALYATETAPLIIAALK